MEKNLPPSSRNFVPWSQAQVKPDPRAARAGRLQPRAVNPKPRYRWACDDCFLRWLHLPHCALITAGFSAHTEAVRH